MIIDGIEKGMMIVDKSTYVDMLIYGNTSIYVDIWKDTVIDYIDKTINTMKNT